jgi:hypothetical protein
MRNPVNRHRTARSLAVLVLLLPSATGGESRAAADAELWVPALAAYGNALATGAEASARHAPAPRASRDLARRLRANDAAERWAPALAVIVPVAAIAGAVASSAPPGALSSGPGGDAAAGAVIIAPVEVAEIPTTPRGDPSGAAGEPEAKDETERWVPAFAVFSGALVQGADGAAWNDGFEYMHTDRKVRVRNHTIEGEPKKVKERYEVVTETIRQSKIWDEVGEDLMVGPVVGGSAEIMTPGLQSVPGRPRFFLHGDVAGYFGPDRVVAKSGDPDPDAIVLPTAPKSFAEFVKGQGISTQVEVDPVLWSAGAGVAFTFDAWGRRFRVRPSFEWFREEVEVSGVVSNVYQTDSGRNYTAQPDPHPDNSGTIYFDDLPRIDPEFFVVAMEGSEEKAYHGIGPGLELEMDAARAGPVMLTLFVSGKAYKMLGDLEVEFSEETADEWGTHTAAWSFEKNPWSYQGNVGVRFRWLPA